ncbi:hypothetical protein BD413DRAFT_495914 [Trametes elegans]|nr:hypothetical protein BD413DRAFT_495914 [Trametes elegans]
MARMLFMSHSPANVYMKWPSPAFPQGQSLGSPPRARNLEVLIIAAATFREDRVHAEANAAYAERSDARRLGNLLLRAQNIRELYVGWFEPATARDPRIGQAIASMARLHMLRLATVSDRCLPLVQSLHGLRCLSLHYMYPNLAMEGTEHEDAQTIPPLLAALRGLPRLHTLALEFFDPAPVPGQNTGASPPISAVADLSLVTSSVHSLEIVPVFPNLRSLFLDLRDLGRPEAAPAAGAGPPRPRPQVLRRLALHSLYGVDSVVRRLNLITEELHIKDVEQNEMSGSLLQIMRAASPVVLSLTGWVEDLPTNAWAELPTLAPRLRVLDLDIRPASRNPGSYVGLENIPDLLRGLPLYSLRISATGSEEPYWPRSRESQPAEGREALMARANQRFADVLAALPRQLVDAVPTLRLLAVMEKVPCGGLEDADAPERPGGAYTRSSDQGGYMNAEFVPLSNPFVPLAFGGARCRWWRVGRKGELEQVAEGKGRRAYESVKDACVRAESISSVERTIDSLPV